jgi:hypothetical protein
MNKRHCDRCDKVLEASHYTAADLIEGYDEKLGTFFLNVRVYTSRSNMDIADLCPNCHMQLRQHRGVR